MWKGGRKGGAGAGDADGGVVEGGARGGRFARPPLRNSPLRLNPGERGGGAASARPPVRTSPMRANPGRGGRCSRLERATPSAHCPCVQTGRGAKGVRGVPVLTPGLARSCPTPACKRGGARRMCGRPFPSPPPPLVRMSPLRANQGRWERHAASGVARGVPGKRRVAHAPSHAVWPVPRRVSCSRANEGTGRGGEAGDVAVS
ncbi:hypothetical protein EDB85DRAFT_2048264, partial [Lactarius pseudohatsudake]